MSIVQRLCLGPSNSRRRGPLRRPSATMASRRCWRGRPAVLAAALGLPLAALLVTLVFLANGVVHLRGDIQLLEQHAAYLEAVTARLSRSWDAVAAPEVVIRRATSELGLVASQRPETVLVVTNEVARERDHGWRRAWQAITGAQAVSAAHAATGHAATGHAATGQAATDHAATGRGVPVQAAAIQVVPDQSPPARSGRP